MASPYMSYTPLHTHLSTLNSNPPLCISIPSSQPHESISSSSSTQLPSNHALAQSYDPNTGLLIRLVNNGLSIQLSSLAFSNQPAAITCERNIEFLFPSPIHIATPTIISFASTIFIFCLSSNGVLFRLKIPFAAGSDLSRSLEGERRFSTEFVVGWNIADMTAWEVVDESCVIAGMVDGSMRKMELRSSNEDEDDELEVDSDSISANWTETALRPPTLLSTLSSFIPHPFSSTSTPSKRQIQQSSPSIASPISQSKSSPHSVVSIKSVLLGDVLAVAFSLSRDKRLRLWNLVTGLCIKTISTSELKTRTGELALSAEHSRSGTPVDGRDESGFTPLLESNAGPQNWMRVLPSIGDVSSFYLALHLAPSADSPGSFAVYSVSFDLQRSSLSSMDYLGAKEADWQISRSGGELRDWEIKYVNGSSSQDMEDDSSSADERSELWAVYDFGGGESKIVIGALSSLIPGFASPEEEEEPDWVELKSPSHPTYTEAYFLELISALEAESETESDEVSILEVSNVFLAHLFNPQLFSPSTLLSALESYISTIISALQASSSHYRRPEALDNSFPTLKLWIPAVVGCHIRPETNTQTGALMKEEWKAKMRKEWLGFHRRCEEIERSARWVLGSVLIQEEEAVGVVLRDGLMVSIPRRSGTEVIGMLGEENDLSVKEAFALLPPASLKPSYGDLVSNDLRSSLLRLASLGHLLTSSLSTGSASLPLVTLEKELDHITSDHLPVALEDFIVEISRDYLLEEISEDVSETLSAEIRRGVDWSKVQELLEMMQTVSNIDRGEEQGLTLLGVAIVAAGVRNSVEVRFRLARDVLFLIFFAISSSTNLKTPEMLKLAGEVLATYHLLSSLRWALGLQVGDESSTPTIQKLPGGEEKLLEKFDGLSFVGGSGTRKISSSTTSNLTVIEALIAAASLPSALPTSFPLSVALSLTTISVLEELPLSIPRNTVEAQKVDVDFVDSLLQQEYPSVAYNLSNRFPLEAGIGYVKAKAALALGKAEEAGELFLKVGGVFHEPQYSQVDLSFLPMEVQMLGLTQYYRHVSSFFEALFLDKFVVQFCDLAISAAALEPLSSNRSTKDLWSKLLKSNLALKDYDAAYMALTANPYKESITEAIGHLVTVMCHADEVARLTQFTFIGLQPIVEKTLEHKARHSDPMAFPNYFLVLYAWHVRRGDYRNAAASMYQQGRRFAETSGQLDITGPKQARSYLLAINALSLVEERHAWLSVSVTADDVGRSRKRRRLTTYVPENKFSPESVQKDVEIVVLEDIKKEYTLVLSSLQLSQRFPGSIKSIISSGEDAVALFVQGNLFDNAISTARSLNVDMTGIFQRLALKCAEASRSQELGIEESLENISWLLHSPTVSSMDGEITERASRYLEIMLSRHDDTSTNFRYRESVLETLLEVDRRLPLPHWLLAHFEQHNPEHLILTFLKFDLYKDAVRYSTKMVRQAPAVELLPTKKASVTRLPYTLFDVVFKVVNNSSDIAAQKMAEGLRMLLEKRITLLENVGR